MKHLAFFQAALAMAVGMLAQTIAARLALPSIVVLLAAGVAIGPDGLGIFAPEVFAGAQSDLVTLAVTVILFEGSLGLRIDQLRRLQRSLSLLLTLGAVISFVVGTAWEVGTYGILGVVCGLVAVAFIATMDLFERLAPRVPVPAWLVGSSLRGADLRTSYRVTVVATRTAGAPEDELPDPNSILDAHTELVVVGNGPDLDRFRRGPAGR